ncbi:hypothetical protein [Actinoplanes sp. G11-F43]|uniref:hypothetical protein n=1 Tax=Actinoplanes sp. G11-F43 TaxID=3424130 RepID=UPI003D33D0D1
MFTASDVVFDRAAVHPEAAPLRAALTARDWPGAKTVLDAAAPMERTGLISLAADEPDIEDLLREALRADPADGTASALLGRHLIHGGWEIRTSYRAQYVSQDQFTRFREWLCRAEQVLIDGAQHNPADPAIWTARLISARGLELGLAETRRRYDRLIAADPDHLPGQLSMVQSLCPKWSGTWELLHEFAREAAEAAPPGGAHGTLVAEAHIEHGLDEVGTDQSNAHGLITYLSQEHVRAEIYQAARRSIGHPDFSGGYGWLLALNMFALCFTLIGDKPAAAAAFQQMEGLATKDPWHWLGDAATEFRKSRDWALGGAR